MTTYSKSGSFGWAGGGKTQAIVDLWAASRFSVIPPPQNSPPPAGNPDAGPVMTTSESGNPGAYYITGIPTQQDYWVRIQYGGQTYWGEVPAATLGGGSPGTISDITSTGGTVTVTDPTGPTVNLEVTTPAGVDLPIADTTSYSVNTSSYANPVTHTGNINTAVFPADTVAWAVALSGDAFPRMLCLSDDTDAAFYFGNGTINPYTHGAFIGYGGTFAGGGVLNVGGNSGAFQLGKDDTNIGAVQQSDVPVQIKNVNTGGQGGTISFVTSGTPSIGGNVGDICISQASPFTIYRCTTAGVSGSAVWTAMVGMTAAGALVPPAFSSAPAYVKGAMYFDTTLNKLRIGGASAWETVTSS